MSKKKTPKGLSPPSEEETRFKDLLRKLVAVPKHELEEKRTEQSPRPRRKT